MAKYYISNGIVGYVHRVVFWCFKPFLYLKCSIYMQICSFLSREHLTTFKDCITIFRLQVHAHKSLLEIVFQFTRSCSLLFLQHDMPPLILL